MTKPVISQGFSNDQRDTAAALYWQAFGAKLGRVMGPDDKGRRFFAATLNPKFALSAVNSDGRLIGLAGFKTADGSLTDATLRDLARVYGWFGALWRGLFLSMLERDLAPDVLLMDGICVAPEARGMGLGTALLNAIKHEATRQGKTSVRLDVIDNNPRARALYERQGFTACGQTHLGPLRHIFGFRRATEMRHVIPQQP